MTVPTALRRFALLAAATTVAALLAGCSAAPDPNEVPVVAIVPAPAELDLAGGGPVRLGPDTRILVSGPGADAVAETVAPALREATGLPLPIEAGGADAAVDGDLVLAVTGAGPAPDAATAWSADESHDIESADGRATLTAASAAGLFRATQSLRQLLPARPSGGTVELPAFRLRDEPRFAYRGAMLDVARHFFTVDEVVRYLDAIALLKLNALHLHLTDDQGWRLAIDGYPGLTELGGATAVGGDPGGFYTQDDYRRIVAAAAERFITVVPEIDLPGHTNAALNAVPELSPGGVAPTPYTGIEVGFSSLSAAPTEAAATDAFLEAVLGQAAALTPGPWLHVGGDESHATSKADYLDLARRIAAIGAATGKTVVGWHELGASTELPPGTVGQYWGFASPDRDTRDEGADAAALTRSFVEQGGRVILSPADVAYLDMKYPDDPDGPLGGKLGQLWADGPTTLEEAYAWEPADVVPGLDEADLLGLEAPIWTETLRAMSEVEYLAFPRIAAIAELAWSPRPASGVRDEAGFHERLAPLGAHWRAMGIAYRPVGGVDWEGTSE